MIKNVVLRKGVLGYGYEFILESSDCISERDILLGSENSQADKRRIFRKFADYGTKGFGDGYKVNARHVVSKERGFKHRSGHIIFIQ